MALRLFFIALSAFEGSIENLEKFSKSNENSTSTIFDVDMKLSDVETEKSLLLALMSAPKSTRIFSLNLHEEILLNHQELNSVWINHKEFIKEFLHHQCQISDFNFHGLFSGSSKTVEIDDTDQSTIFGNMQQSIGSGSLLFSSLINHSCTNNVLRVYVEGKVISVVCHPIAKGSQLFDCYK